MLFRNEFFPIFGLPSILHSDNGKELVNQLITEIVESWPGTVRLVSGRPHHTQSQGLVEQAHYTLERMLSAKITEGAILNHHLGHWLPHIICKYDSYITEPVSAISKLQ